MKSQEAGEETVEYVLHYLNIHLGEFFLMSICSSRCQADYYVDFTVHRLKSYASLEIQTLVHMDCGRHIPPFLLQLFIVWAYFIC